MAVSPQQRSERRFNLPLCIFLLLAIAAIGAYAARSELQAEKGPAMLATAQEASDLVRDFIDPTIQEANNLARLIRQAKEAGSGRELIRGLAVPTAQMRPDYVGVAVVFEPNGFDGRDADFAAKGLENDDSGRFVPYYYNKLDGTVGIDPLVMTIEAGIEGWYLAPLRSGKPILTDPYTYPINGVDVLMATISVPLVSDGRAFGVTTIDFMLKELQKGLNDLRSPEKGEVMVLAGDQSWVFHPEAGRIGTKLLSGARGAEALREETAIGEALAAFRAADQGTPFRFVGPNGDTEFVLNRISFDSVENAWFVVVPQPDAPASMHEWMRAGSKPAIAAGIAFGFVFVISLVVSAIRPDRIIGATRSGHRPAITDTTVVRRRGG